MVQLKVFVDKSNMLKILLAKNLIACTKYNSNHKYNTYMYNITVNSSYLFLLSITEASI